MSEWERCLAREAADFAEAEAQDADRLAAMQAEWQQQPAPVLEYDEWDENEYDYQ